MLNLSACSTAPSTPTSVAGKAIDHIAERVPDALLVRCLPRVMQADANPTGDPAGAVVVIRTNNGRLDECARLHDLVINHILNEGLNNE